GVLSESDVRLDLHEKSAGAFEGPPNERRDSRLVIDQQDLFQEGHCPAAYQASDMPAPRGGNYGWSRHALAPDMRDAAAITQRPGGRPSPNFRTRPRPC